MRNVILILILAVVALILAVASGFLDIRQTRSAEPPELSANGSGVTATGGQAPAFDVQTGKVAVGTEGKNVTVQVPAIEIQPPAEANQASTNQSR